MQKQPPVEYTSSWLIAILAGSIINILLFAILAGMGKERAPLPPPSPIKLTVGFVQKTVQPQLAPATPPPESVPQKKVQKPRPEPVKKPVKTVPELKQPVEQPRFKAKPPEEKRVVQSPPPPVAVPSPWKPATAAQPRKHTKPVPFYKLTGVPRFIHEEKPVYPASLLKQGREATVKLEIYIDVNGQVRDIKLLQSAGREFDQAAIRAIRASTFAPGSIKGKPVPTLMRLPVKFTLR